MSVRNYSLSPVGISLPGAFTAALRHHNSSGAIRRLLRALTTALWSGDPVLNDDDSGLPSSVTLFGRDQVISDATKQIVAHDSLCTAIVGPIGIGKTAIAQNVIHSDCIVEHFSGNRCWISCDSILSTDHLIAAILKALRTPSHSTLPLRQTGESTASPADVVNAVADALSHRRAPLLVVFDGFDSIWTRTALRDLITRVFALFRTSGQVVVILTMRGAEPPPFADRTISVDPLSVDAARWLFLSIHARSDSYLEELIQAVDAVPLAVTLLALAGRERATSPFTLLQLWNTERIGLLELGNDRSNNMTIATRTSCDELPVEYRSAALDLLATLAMLPDGVRGSDLALLAPHINGSDDVAHIIAQLALARSHKDGRIQLFSPVREYALRYHQLDVSSRQNVYTYYFTRAKRGASPPGTKSAVDRVHFAMKQEGNIFAILEDALERDCRCAVEAAVEYADLLRCTTARPNIARKAVEASRKLNSCGMLAQCLEWCADANEAVGALRLAASLYGEAEANFRELGDSSAAARCLQIRGLILFRCGDKEDGRNRLEAARELFKLGTDTVGEAKCLLALAGIYMHEQGDRYSDLCDKARITLDNQNDIEGIALYQQRMITVHCRHGRYHEAGGSLFTAITLFQRSHNFPKVAECLTTLAMNTRNLGQRYEMLEQSLSIHLKLGRKLEAAFGMRNLAEVLTMMGRLHDALALYEQAISLFWRFRFVFAAAECQLQTGRIHIRLGRLEDARLSLQLAAQQNRVNGDLKRAAVATHLLHLLEGGNLGEATALAEKRCALHPDYPCTT
ncbi:hypothetical protein WOLCODRAFT_165311 [Wolfiporia cocos MD-104 SS10]|uniref:Orc1-like AAA ATPase domain-containing protein n=1 Tax=Wolfiporia cocos (strain MD-104) TaxID=742152 RepID=A0A2H3JR76_WOLCO|nr:hypothetical protein WOLCODRAFT_165311 [Wolfiporia cocos MD-104 SS10]